jgi:hypothetical protein
LDCPRRAQIAPYPYTKIACHILANSNASGNLCARKQQSVRIEA